jgi:hypothetical protein
MQKTAVLFLVFNRPDVTAKCFEAIRAAGPPRLYVAADGPRAGRLGEAERCEQVRLIATAVDWPCEVKTLFRAENLGCRQAVSGALDWFFESEPEGIVLEDDCLASADWFRFAEEMLDRYRDDHRIMCVSASHFHGAAHVPEHSYFFSRYSHCWGWASWRRAWIMYDADMAAWPSLRTRGWLRGIGHGSRAFEAYWHNVFDRVHAQHVNSWAYRWMFSCWTQSGLTILPERNLVSNIGFGDNATHTDADNPLKDATPLESINFPLRHPSHVIPDLAADLWTDLNIFGITLMNWMRGHFRSFFRL